MKLASFAIEGGATRLGLVIGDGVIDLASHLPDAPADMIELIARWSSLRSALESLAVAGRIDRPLASVVLQPPVARPGKIFCIGLNYADHVAESGMAKPTEQVWFTKAGTSVNSPHGTIELPRASEQLDYEAELAFVIGKRCRHVTAEQAADAIFGYCVANDVSVRDWQLKTSQFALGKSFDTHCPYGPWIVTPDEVGDPHALGIRSFVNGERRQASDTKELVYNCFQQVAHLSKAMTLEPGDLILTGTPGGVGIGFKPARWLKEGDVVRVEIDRIGAIENRVVVEEV